MNSKKSKTLTKTTQYYMYGKHSVLAAIKNPDRVIYKIYCTNSFYKSSKNFLEKQTILEKLEIVDNKFIDNKLKINAAHQGIIALVKTKYLNTVEEFQFNTTVDKIAVLDQITDPQNIGTIIRSAAAFGITKVIIPKDNSPDENASIAKTACGCLELVQIANVTNLRQSLAKLKNQGFWVVGMDINGNQDIKLIKNLEKIIIIIGSEGKGMRNLTSKSCDYLLNIPISPEVESLNAASAASIIFYLVN
ncbi:MAG TPA: 23S rRNA (guanosine(2251)-2'-O)-methyltransferase RlmB [Candidatus Megaira endosymbiont of Nemacystus decipiens]|nr:23S rRNA (guanosine(2251)-2'-O)-methyltransferase RlmB [Candidatus Megaera endosymbiont of Nemacystus decipiens]